MVVDGADEMVGSDRAAVLAAIGEAHPQAIAPISFAADGHSVAIGSGTGSGKVVLVRFARHRTTHVGAGENGGRIADDFNGVTTLATLGAWDGSRLELAIEPPVAGEGLAVLVQASDGQMLGAAMVLGSG